MTVFPFPARSSLISPWVPALSLWFAAGPAFARSSSDDLTFALAVGILVGVLLFFWGFDELKKKRAIEDIPTSTVRAMAPGQVEVVGTVVDWNMMEAPFSRQACVYYAYEVEEYRRQGKRSRWVTVKEEDTGKHPFCLEDGTGKVTVLPEGAEVHICDPWELTSGMFTDIPPHIDSFLSRSGLDCRGLFGFEKKLRFTEVNIKPGERIYAMASCRSPRDTDVLPPKGSLQEGLLAKDKAGEGLFILSDRSQKDLISKFATNAFLGVFGGSALFLTCLLGLLEHLR